MPGVGKLPEEGGAPKVVRCQPGESWLSTIAGFARRAAITD